MLSPEFSVLTRTQVYLESSGWTSVFDVPLWVKYELWV